MGWLDEQPVSHLPWIAFLIRVFNALENGFLRPLFIGSPFWTVLRKANASIDCLRLASLMASFISICKIVVRGVKKIPFRVNRLI